MTYGLGRHSTLIVNYYRKNENIVTKATIFPLIGKKNTQSSVFDADEKTQLLGQRMNNIL